MSSIMLIIDRIKHDGVIAAIELDDAVASGCMVVDEDCLELCWRIIACEKILPIECAAILMKILLQFSTKDVNKKIVDSWRLLGEDSQRNIANTVATPNIMPTQLARQLFDATDSTRLKHLILAGIVKTFYERQCVDDLLHMINTVGKHEDAIHQQILDRIVCEAKRQIGRL